MEGGRWKMEDGRWKLEAIFSFLKSQIGVKTQV
jgi:hypothetical protein